MTAKKVGQKGRSNPIGRKVPDLERHCYLQNWEQTPEFFYAEDKICEVMQKHWFLGPNNT